MSVKSSITIQKTITFDPNMKLGLAGPGTKNFFNLQNFRDAEGLDIPQPTQQFAIRGWGNLSAPGTPGYKAPQGTWKLHNPTERDGFIILTLKWVAMCLDLETDHSTPWSKEGSCHWSNIRVIPKSINRMMSNDATLTNEDINILIQGMTPDIRAKLNIPEWFSLPNQNGLEFLKTLKFEYFQTQSL
jgi:hypothetical protein